MPLGPVELVVVQFPGNEVKGDIVPAIKELVEQGTVRIIDITFLKKDANGHVTQLEMSELDDADYSVFDPIIAEIDGLVSQEDIEELADTLENNTTAVVMLFEDIWAIRMQKAILNAHGKLILSDRIPHSVVEQALAGSRQQ
jgi:uncharacterized membrane protein